MTEQTKTESYIWLVRGHLADENARGWRPSEFFKNNERMPEDILKSMRQDSVGWSLPQDRFPTDNYPRPGNYPAAHEQPVPQIFSNDFKFLSEASADVVGQFDLGEGAIYPTRLWHPDRITPMPGTFFYLNIGNKKLGFIPERSKGMKDVGHGKWLVPLLPPKNIELRFSDSVLQGPDLWIDPKIIDNFFISDRLKQALDDRNLSKDWKLIRCSVVAS